MKNTIFSSVFVKNNHSYAEIMAFVKGELEDFIYKIDTFTCKIHLL